MDGFQKVFAQINNWKINSRYSDAVSQKIDFKAFGLDRDHPPAGRYKYFFVQKRPFPRDVSLKKSFLSKIWTG